MPHNIICGISWSLFLVVFTISSVAAEDNGMVPVPVQEMTIMMNESSLIMRRKLNRYQVCSLCTCCGRGYCLASPCCYAINCNIPNRPYGYCSFTPKACNCFGCHIQYTIILNFLSPLQSYIGSLISALNCFIKVSKLTKL